MRKKQLLLIILIIMNILFIWGNSMLSQEQSRHLSVFFRDILRSIFDFAGGSDAISDHMVRKSAHMFEFLVLGILVTLLIGKARFKNCVMTIAAGVLVASVDETIQIFTGRGPAVKDVMIDTAGFLAGFLFIMLLKQMRKNN